MLLDVWATSAHTSAVVTTVTTLSAAVSIVAGRRTQPLVRWKYQCSALPGEITLTETAKRKKWHDNLAVLWGFPYSLNLVEKARWDPTGNHVFRAFVLSSLFFIPFVPLSPSLISPFTLTLDGTPYKTECHLRKYVKTAKNPPLYPILGQTNTLISSRPILILPSHLCLLRLPSHLLHAAEYLLL
jgi:hypothetical protein